MYNTDSNILPYTTFEVSKALDLAIAKTQMWLPIETPMYQVWETTCSLVPVLMQEKMS